MANSPQHLDILVPERAGSPNKIKLAEKLDRQKKIGVKAAEEILKLKDEIENKVPFHVWENLVLNVTNYSASGLEKLLEGAKRELRVFSFLLDHEPVMDMADKLNQLKNAPQASSNPHDQDRLVYQNTMFSLEKAFEETLIAELRKIKTTKAADYEKAAQDVSKKLFQEWSGKEALGAFGDDILSAELKKPPAALKNKEIREHLNKMTKYQERFKNLLKEFKESGSSKKIIIKNGLEALAVQFLEKPGAEPDEEAAARFMETMESLLLVTVGEKDPKHRISKKEFEEALRELQDLKKFPDSRIAKLMNVAKTHEKDEAFNELLDMDDEEIQTELAATIRRQKKATRESFFNPTGNPGRKFGDLMSLILYGGEKVLYGVIITNVALAGFNPMKMLQNPVMWATVLGTAAIANYYHPLFEGNSPIKQASIADLKSKIDKLDDNYPTVVEWMSKFDRGDLAPEGKIGKLLAQKESSSNEKSLIYSDEIEKFIDEDERPSKKITEEKEAKLLFKYLRACRNEDVSPSELIDA